MQKQWHLGIDIGTSRCKASLISSSGKEQRVAAVAFPQRLIVENAYLNELIELAVFPVLREVLSDETHQIISFVVSGIAPSLVGYFSTNHEPCLLFSHLSPAPVKSNLHSDVFDQRLISRKERTEFRIDSAIVNIGQKPSVLLPLASAIVHALTGTITLDPINAYELGFSSIEQLRSFCNLDTFPEVLLQTCGRKFAGCDMKEATCHSTTDTCASMVGAGVRNVGDGMIYYGTYHCALELRLPIHECIFADHIDQIPYVWHVSLPKYGQFLETMLCAISPNLTRDDVFTAFDVTLGVSRADLSNKYGPKVYLVLDEIVSSNSSLKVNLLDLPLSLDHKGLIRAIASPLGEALSIKRLAGSLDKVSSWFAGGGGAKSLMMVELTSQIAGLSQKLYAGADTAIGSALIGSTKLMSQHEESLVAQFSGSSMGNLESFQNAANM